MNQLQFWQRCDQLRIQTVVRLCDQHLRIRAGRCDLRIGTAAAAQLYDLQLLFLLRQKLAAQALCISQHQYFHFVSSFAPRSSLLRPAWHRP